MGADASAFLERNTFTEESKEMDLLPKNVEAKASKKSVKEVEEVKPKSEKSSQHSLKDVEEPEVKYYVLPASENTETLEEVFESLETTDENSEIVNFEITKTQEILNEDFKVTEPPKEPIPEKSKTLKDSENKSSKNISDEPQKLDKKFQQIIKKIQKKRQKDEKKANKKSKKDTKES